MFNLFASERSSSSCFLVVVVVVVVGVGVGVGVGVVVVVVVVVRGPSGQTRFLRVRLRRVTKESVGPTFGRHCRDVRWNPLDLIAKKYVLKSKIMRNYSHTLTV